MGNWIREKYLSRITIENGKKITEIESSNEQGKLKSYYIEIQSGEHIDVRHQN